MIYKWFNGHLELLVKWEKLNKPQLCRSLTQKKVAWPQQSRMTWMWMHHHLYLVLKHKTKGTLCRLDIIYQQGWLMWHTGWKPNWHTGWKPNAGGTCYTQQTNLAPVFKLKRTMGPENHEKSLKSVHRLAYLSLHRYASVLVAYRGVEE